MKKRHNLLTAFFVPTPSKSISLHFIITYVNHLNTFKKQLFKNSKCGIRFDKSFQRFEFRLKKGPKGSIRVQQRFIKVQLRFKMVQQRSILGESKVQKRLNKGSFLVNQRFRKGSKRLNKGSTKVQNGSIKVHARFIKGSTKVQLRFRKVK